MANNKGNAENKKFYGNKYCTGDPDKQTDRFFCCYAQNRLETGKRLAALRRKMNKTQEGFVEFLRNSGYLGISRTTLCVWESGRGKIGDEEIEALCTALRCSRDELVVYRTRETDDERDQLVPLKSHFFYFIDEHLLMQMLVFLLTVGFWSHSVRLFYT